MYKYVQDEINEDDFFELSPQQYKRLPASDQNDTWYTINPSKLKQAHVSTPELIILSEDNKRSLLNAIRMIWHFSSDLPANASFLERLLYAKRVLPRDLF